MIRLIMRLILIIGGLYSTLLFLNRSDVNQSNVHQLKGTLVITSQPRSDLGTPVEPPRTGGGFVTGADRQEATPIVYGADLNLTDNVKFRVEYRRLGSQRSDSVPASLDSDATTHMTQPPDGFAADSGRSVPPGGQSERHRRALMALDGGERAEPDGNQ